jgi:hypothetical protein
MTRWLFALLAAVALFTGVGLSLDGLQPQASVQAASEPASEHDRDPGQHGDSQTASTSSGEAGTDASEHDSTSLLPSLPTAPLVRFLAEAPRCPRQTSLVSPCLAGPLRPPRV